MNKNEKQIIFWVCGFCLIVGVLIGIVLGYYALPHINYTITTQPGTYTFDIGPTAATIFGQIYKPTNYTSATTKVLDQGSMPVPDTNWEQVPNTYNDTIALFELNPNLNTTTPRLIINTNCYQSVICPCAMNTTQPCMVACYEWVNKTGC